MKTAQIVWLAVAVLIGIVLLLVLMNMDWNMKSHMP